MEVKAQFSGHLRSPDITPLDVFLWVYVKDIMYQTKTSDITDLNQKITDAIMTTDKAMLQRNRVRA